jgi:hypothetical protein
MTLCVCHSALAAHTTSSQVLYQMMTTLRTVDNVLRSPGTPLNMRQHMATVRAMCVCARARSHSTSDVYACAGIAVDLCHSADGRRDDDHTQ